MTLLNEDLEIVWERNATIPTTSLKDNNSTHSMLPPYSAIVGRRSVQTVQTGEQGIGLSDGIDKSSTLSKFSISSGFLASSTLIYPDQAPLL